MVLLYSYTPCWICQECSILFLYSGHVSEWCLKQVTLKDEVMSHLEQRGLAYCLHSRSRFPKPDIRQLQCQPTAFTASIWVHGITSFLSIPGGQWNQWHADASAVSGDIGNKVPCLSSRCLVSSASIHNTATGLLLSR